MRVPEVRDTIYLILKRFVSDGFWIANKLFAYHDPGVPCHFCLIYGKFHFGTRERLLIVTRKVPLGQLSGRN
jgi:hypothetical protein